LSCPCSAWDVRESIWLIEKRLKPSSNKAQWHWSLIPIFDIHTAALMREHGIRRIASADQDFARFAGLEVINPIRRSKNLV
jgi:predicted nucleic acid-binding protein